MNGRKISHEEKRFTDAQIMQISKQVESGVPFPELCREHGMSSTTFYSWRSRYSGMNASLISQMKSLAAENARIKRMYVEVSMQCDLLKDALKKVTRACDGTDLVKQASIRLACAPFGILEAHYRYEPRLSDESEGIAAWLRYLTEKHKRWGSGLCFLHSRNMRGFRWNRKRMYGIYKWEGLHLRMNRVKLDKLCDSGSSQRVVVGRLCDGSDGGRSDDTGFVRG